MKLIVLAASRWKVCAIADDDGASEVVEFLLSLDVRLRRRVLALLDQGAVRGNQFWNKELSRPLEDGVCEYKRSSVRVFYFFDEARLIVCTHAFQKKQQRTPRAQINRAKELRAQYVKAKQRRGGALEEVHYDRTN